MLDLAGIGPDLFGLSPLAIQQRHDEAFDVEAVTKKFFADFCEIFSVVAKDIRKNNDWHDDIVEKETQTLLNRLLFLYFIQRKGWLNREREYLHKRFKEHLTHDKDGFSYYSRFLHPLFMRLSTEMKEAASFLGDVPFLNGGLFDDEYGGQQRQAKLLRRTRMKVSNRALKRVFDEVLEKYNFTVREDTPLNQDVSIDPEMLGKIFESLVLQLEQSDTGGKTSRHDTGSYYTPRPIVHYLCREALRVCLETKGEDRHENIGKLLAIDASDGIDTDERAILDECLSPEQARRLLDELDSLRACDPAVGSGAFPLGLLHELVNLSRLCEARSRGRDPVEVDVDWLYNTKSRFIQRVIYGVDIQERAVEICKLRLWLSLMVDLDIGVDVDACSVSAFRSALRRKVTPLPNLDYKIRRADSLIDQIHGEPIHLEAHADPQFQVILSRLTEAKQEFYRAKKLETKRKWRFKILDATAELGQHEIAWERNRLGELIADEKHNARIVQLDRAVRELGNMREQIRSANKLKAHQQDDALERFSKRFDDPEKPTFVWQLDFAEVFHRNGSKLRKGGDLLSVDGNGNADASSGFDIIVANPPYVRQELIGKQKPELQKTYPTVYTGTADLYCYFYARAVQLLRSGGSVAFISSNKWFRANYGANLRKFIAENCCVRGITDFGELPVFENAATFPMIFIASKGKVKRAPTIFTQVKSLEPPYPDVGELVRQRGQALPADGISGAKWTLKDASSAARMRKMEAVGIPLGELVNGQLYRGVVTGLNEVFYIHREMRDRLVEEDPASKQLIKPVLFGDDVRRYEVHFREMYLIFMRRGTNAREYPAVLQYLATHRANLTPKRNISEKRGRKPGDYEWYEIQDVTEYYPIFGEPKILFPQTCKEARFVMDVTPYHIDQTIYTIAVCDWYLLAVLNTNAAFDYLKKKCAVLGDEDQGGRIRILTQYLQYLPIPDASADERDKLGNLSQQAQRLHAARRKCVEKFLRACETSLAKSNSRNLLEQPWTLSSEQFRRRVPNVPPRHLSAARDETIALTERIEKLENEINDRVAQLYGLTNDEAKIVTGVS
jgi:type I restriction-modification system DNA methylase subunit